MEDPFLVALSQVRSSGIFLGDPTNATNRFFGILRLLAAASLAGVDLARLAVGPTQASRADTRHEMLVEH